MMFSCLSIIYSFMCIFRKRFRCRVRKNVCFLCTCICMNKENANVPWDLCRSPTAFPYLVRPVKAVIFHTRSFFRQSCVSLMISHEIFSASVSHKIFFFLFPPELCKPDDPTRSLPRGSRLIPQVFALVCLDLIGNVKGYVPIYTLIPLQLPWKQNTNEVMVSNANIHVIKWV